MLGCSGRNAVNRSIFTFTLGSGGHFEFESFEDVGVASSCDAADHVVVAQVANGSLDSLAVNADQFAKRCILNNAGGESVYDSLTIVLNGHGKNVWMNES